MAWTHCDYEWTLPSSAMWPGGTCFSSSSWWSGGDGAEQQTAQLAGQIHIDHPPQEGLVFTITLYMVKLAVVPWWTFPLENGAVHNRQLSVNKGHQVSQDVRVTNLLFGPRKMRPRKESNFPRIVCWAGRVERSGCPIGKRTLRTLPIFQALGSPLLQLCFLPAPMFLAHWCLCSRHPSWNFSLH